MFTLSILGLACFSLISIVHASVVHIDILDEGRASGAYVEFSLAEGQGRAGKDVWISGHSAAEQVFVGETWQVHKSDEGTWSVSLTVSTQDSASVAPADKAAASYRRDKFEITIRENPSGDPTIGLIGAPNCLTIHVFQQPAVLNSAPNTAQSPGTKQQRPRQPLQETHVRPAIFQDNQVATSNIGVGSWDAKWSNYGVYLQRLIEAVQLQWDQILEEARTHPTPGTQVTVKFRLDTKGKVLQIVDVGGTSTAQGKGYCVSAITSRAPYGDWTDDMIAALGASTELTFVFYYK